MDPKFILAKRLDTLKKYQAHTPTPPRKKPGIKLLHISNNLFEGSYRSITSIDDWGFTLW
jgi:hypothetical protein